MAKLPLVDIENVRLVLALGWNSRELERGVLDAVRERGWSINMQFQRNRALPPEESYDAVICNGLKSLKHQTAFKIGKKPTVVLSEENIESNCPRVFGNNEKMGKMAAEYFLGKEFVNFATFTLYRNKTNTDRLNAFEQTLRKNGIRRSVRLKASPRETENGAVHKWLGNALNSLNKPCAIYATSDDYARILIESCQMHAIDVPGDIVILGTNNEVDMCELMPIPLSSVDVDLYQNGYMGIVVLEKILKRQPFQLTTCLLPKAIVERQSTDTAPIENIQLRRVMQLIRECYHRPLTNREIAQAAGLSLSGLHRLFQEETSTTVKAEVDRLRLQKAKTLLGGTHKKMAEIASHCGHLSVENFSRFFKKHTGVTLKEYRNNHQRIHKLDT